MTFNARRLNCIYCSASPLDLTICRSTVGSLRTSLTPCHTGLPKFLRGLIGLKRANGAFEHLNAGGL
jgi:hypothetical protein